jgi:hypothetical protein
MEHDEKVSIRIPSKLRDALEDERKRMSRKIGAEVKTSAVVRAILERSLRRARATKAA